MTKKIRNSIQKKQYELLYIDYNNILSYENINILEKYFKNIFFYDSYNKVIKKIKEKEIDVIFINIDIDFIKPFKIIKNIKKIDSQIPIIIFSSQDESAYLKKAIQLGIYDYINTPIKKGEIKYLLKKIDKTNTVNNDNYISKQYEKMVLKNSIISKIDITGKIKYVNNNLCALTGIKKEDIIGNHYSKIIDKRENLKSIKAIYKNLNNKNFSWKGTIKSLSYDDKKIYLYTTINPILDENKNIVALLAVHLDITFEEKLKEYFKNQLDLKTFNLNDALKLNTQYEMAINKSNILSKTDIDGKITYVNDKFCDISGYAKHELIEKTHNIIRHKDTQDDVYKQLWNTIKSGKSWNGILKNKKKNKESYWVSTLIIPIKDKNSKIKEFISISHDLTELFNLHNEIEETQREMLYKMGEVAEKRSKETGNHVKRVAQYSKDLALLYGLDTKEANLIFAASPMHDIGKVGIPDDILKKPDKLNDEEFEIMKTHSEIGYNILKNSKRAILKVASIIAREHHEKYDGTGYPRGLKGTNIHIYGRITAIADVFDALGSDRYYKKAWPDKKIFDFFNTQKGKHFDPKLVDLFMENIEMFLKTRDKFQD